VIKYFCLVVWVFLIAVFPEIYESFYFRWGFMILFRFMVALFAKFLWVPLLGVI